MGHAASREAYVAVFEGQPVFDDRDASHHALLPPSAMHMERLRDVVGHAQVGYSVAFTFFDADQVDITRLQFRRVLGADVVALRPVEEVPASTQDDTNAKGRVVAESTYWLLSDQPTDADRAVFTVAHALALFPAFTCGYGSVTASTKTLGLAVVFEDVLTPNTPHVVRHAADMVRELVGLSHLFPTRQWQHRLNDEHVAVGLGTRSTTACIKELHYARLIDEGHVQDFAKVAFPSSGKFVSLRAGGRLALHGKEWMPCMAALAEGRNSAQVFGESVHLWRHAGCIVSVVHDPVGHTAVPSTALEYLRQRTEASATDNVLLAALRDASIPSNTTVDAGLQLSLRMRLGLLSELLFGPHVIVVAHEALELLLSDDIKEDAHLTAEAVQRWLSTFPSCVVVTYDDVADIWRPDAHIRWSELIDSVLNHVEGNTHANQWGETTWTDISTRSSDAETDSGDSGDDG